MGIGNFLGGILKNTGAKLKDEFLQLKAYEDEYKTYSDNELRKAFSKTRDRKRQAVIHSILKKRGLIP